MELNDIRAGNYVKEFEYSSRGRSHEPFFRVIAEDIPYHNFLVPIPIDLEWCKRLHMDIEERIHPSGNYDWIAEAPGLKVRSDKGEVTVFLRMGGSMSILEHIKYVHQLQNFYYGIWGFEIDEENPTEFYKIKNE